MNGYVLYHKDGENALVIRGNDDEILYVLRKLERSRVKWLKQWAGDLIVDFFSKQEDAEIAPQVQHVQSGNQQTEKQKLTEKD